MNATYRLVWNPQLYSDGGSPGQIMTGMENTQWLDPFESQWDYNPSHHRISYSAPDGDNGCTNPSGCVDAYSNSCEDYTETCSDTTPQGKIVHITGWVGDSDLQKVVPKAPKSPDGLGWFIVKNSWGSCTSDRGFIYIPFSYVANQTRDLHALMGVQ
jgi:hypothetical protein